MIAQKVKASARPVGLCDGGAVVVRIGSGAGEGDCLGPLAQEEAIRRTHLGRQPRVAQEMKGRLTRGAEAFDHSIEEVAFVIHAGTGVGTPPFGQHFLSGSLADVGAHFG